MAKTGCRFLVMRRLFPRIQMNIVISRNVSSALKVSFYSRQPLISASNYYCNLKVLKSFKHDECDSDSESEETSDDFRDLCSSVEVQKNIESLRNLLYPISTDPIIAELKSCASVQDVFDTIRKHEADMNGSHISQAVLILWDLQEIFVKINFSDQLQHSIRDVFLDPRTILSDYISLVKTHQDFGLLMKLVQHGVPDMTADAAACTLLYLSKMGVNVDNSVLQSLLHHCENIIESMGHNVPLTALSRFAVAIHSHGGLWLVFVWQKILPLVISKIEPCDNANDLRLLTICLNSMLKMIDSSTLEMFKSKVKAMVENGSLTAEDSRTVVKAALFLTLPQWFHDNIDVIRMLLSMFKGKVSSLDPRDLVAVHRIFLIIFEPADILEEIQKYAAQILAQQGDLSVPTQSSADLLSCLVAFSSPGRKKVFEKIVSPHIENVNYSNCSGVLFKILRSLKTSDVKLCDTYWSNTLKDLESIPFERRKYLLLKHCYRYMHFNNNLGGTYRHYEFEKKVIQWLIEEIKNGMCGLIPFYFTRSASFIIAYGSTSRGKNSEATLKYIVDKLIDLSCQLNEIDCRTISRGIQVATSLPRMRYASESTLRQFARLDSLLNECAKLHLEKKDWNLITTNMLIQSYIGRKGAQQSEVFLELMKRYENFQGTISSKSVRDAAASLQINNYLIPVTVDRLADYIIEQNVNLLAEIVEKVLTLCYTLGYRPANADTFLSRASDIILRDKERFMGLPLLQAALALSYFHHLPEELVHYIFTVDFLERLDEEISLCYSKATYPVRVRHFLMQLNRAVCLDYPELDIPWFHQKYCQEIAALEPVQQSTFHEEVKTILVEVLKRREFVKADVYSPYGYKIDFQIVLDKDHNPLHMRQQADKDVAKLAILLLKPDAFCSNVNVLKGPHQLKQRHLEMLGYHVINITYNLWHSMYMAEPGAKFNHIHKLIWS